MRVSAEVTTDRRRRESEKKLVVPTSHNLGQGQEDISLTLIMYT